ncbi:MAG: hypothetical protein K8R63_04715 [Bacteroidales bacterium]|nr:hypothetical protein [Bacteroidales bacterium]
MKVRVLNLIILLSTVIIANGQNQWNIIDNTSKWSVVTDYGGYYDTHFIRFGSEDTLIEDLLYRKVYNTYDPDELNWSFMDLFIREDTATRQVFLRNTLGEEGMIYDFSVGISDTVSIHNVISNTYISMEVIDIDSILIDETYRKQFHFEPVNWPYWDTWVEGIGSMGQGIIYSGFYNTSPWYTLLCYNQNDTVYYMHPDYTACYYPYVSIEDNEIRSFKVYYNYEANCIEVGNLPANQFFEFELYNLLGEKILCVPLSGKVRINLNNYGLKDGLFIYVIKHKEYIFSDKLMIFKKK